MAKSGASKGAKKIDAFNSGKLEGVNVSQFIGPRVDTHLPSGGPGSLLDRRDTDFIRQQREQHERRREEVKSDIEYGVVKKKKSNGRTKETT